MKKRGKPFHKGRAKAPDIIQRGQETQRTDKALKGAKAKEPERGTLKESEGQKDKTQKRRTRGVKKGLAKERQSIGIAERDRSEGSKIRCRNQSQGVPKHQRRNWRRDQ